jgi:amino acid transporter
MISGSVCALLAGFLPIELLAELTSVGTLFAFTLVCLGVSVLRVRMPDAERAFRVPFGAYAIPVAGALTNLLLICTATTPTLYRLFGWMLLGLVAYFAYARRHSHLGRAQREEEDEGDEAKDAMVQEGNGHLELVPPSYGILCDVSQADISKRWTINQQSPLQQ